MIKPGDTIHYNPNHFHSDYETVIRSGVVVEVAAYETGAGTYEEYKTEAGVWVSELELVN